MEEDLKGKIIVDDTVYETYYTRKYLSRKPINIGNTNIINAVIPGVIKDILVKKGDRVTKNQPLLILEAMKMKNRIFSPRNGIVEEIFVNIDDKVAKDQPLIKITD
ncbi:MAG TPA: acetyl-CoA carboxylase biotin carboxyl carrier protein subunit [Bacteroidota bacterium]|nr:acetyl-CoA carboxylase biotin carboxyl carrier protein subunit [Candidatus Kapabacteria bacterium]HRS01851.1 acetyl-CoA carboxylase biotin carboxyl carrier protein subunit [Bacteroidota bacterium]